MIAGCQIPEFPGSCSWSRARQLRCGIHQQFQPGSPARPSIAAALAADASALAGQRRVAAVLAHAYVRRFGGDLASGEPALRTFADALDLVAAVPVHELETPDDLAALHGLPAFIEEDLIAARPAR